MQADVIVIVFSDLEHLNRSFPMAVVGRLLIHDVYINDVLTHDVYINDVLIHDVYINDVLTHDVYINDVLTHDVYINESLQNGLQRTHKRISAYFRLGRSPGEG